MKITEKQVIDQQRKISKNRVSDKGYLESGKAEDNLITKFSNWEEIKNEFQKGNGRELEKKFLAVHSSSALCVNNFAPFKENKDRISFCGNLLYFCSVKILLTMITVYFENTDLEEYV